MTLREIKAHTIGWIGKQQFQPIPLLSVQTDGITAIVHPGRHPRLSCSQSLRKQFKFINTQIAIDWNGPRTIEGIIYTIYRYGPNGNFCPLYVGIARCAGRGGTLSVLFKHDMNRFHHGRKTNGHIDKIGRTILGEINTYTHWVAALFKSGANLTRPNPSAVLKSPTFVHVEMWSSTSPSIIPGSVHTSIEGEEMRRVSVLRKAGFGSQLQNKTGNTD